MNLRSSRRTTGDAGAEDAEDPKRWQDDWDDDDGTTISAPAGRLQPVERLVPP